MPYFLIVNSVVQPSEAFDDVITDQSTVLMSCTIVEPIFESSHEKFLLLYAHQTDLPERLHAMSCCNESFIADDREQGRKVLEHSALWITLGEIAQNLSRDCASVIVVVRKVREYVLPNVVRPFDRVCCECKDLVKGFVLQLTVCRPKIGEVLRDHL